MSAIATSSTDFRLSGQVDIFAQGGGKKPTAFKMVVNSGRQPMNLEGFFDPVVIDLEGAEFEKDTTPVILEHNTTQRIGHTTQQRIDQSGIHASGVVSGSGEAAHQFVADAKAGFPFQSSVGAKILERSTVEPGDTVEVNGETFQGPLIVARRTLVKEISIVCLGADSNTPVSISAKRSAMTATTRTSEARIEAAAEEQRIDGIRAAANSRAYSHVQIVNLDGQRLSLADAKAHAIESGMALMEFENLLLKAELNVIPDDESTRQGIRLHASNNRTNSSQVIEAALAKHCNVRNLEKHYGEATLHAADRLPVSCMMDVARECAKSAGHTLEYRNKDAVLRAAFSSTEFGSLLSNIAGKQLEDAYRAFPSAARVVARELSANDFKEKTGVRMTGDIKFQEVAKDGEIKHSRLSDSSYTYKLATFARMFGMDRQSIINDDLGGMDELPRLLGRGAAIALEVEFWTLVLANTGNFFHSDNGNLISGADSVLSSSGLAALAQKLLEQVDTEGHPINVQGNFLVVPPELKYMADELYVSKTLNVGGGSSTDDDAIPAENTLFGKYLPVVSPYIGINPNRADQPAGASDSAYYLFGNPNDVAAFGIAYLDGRKVPTIEEEPQAFNLLGTQWRGFLDFGVCQVDHRGAAKSAGA